MATNTSQLAAYIWSLAELLRGDFKQSQYGRIILPFTILRRLECVLEGTKDKVLKEAEKHAGKPEEAREKFLLKAAGQPIYNTSPMDLSKLPVPPIDEARQIVDSLNRRLNVLAGIDAAAAAQIELLQERRTALISAAVTGKIDVRNWKPPQSSAEDAVA